MIAKVGIAALTAILLLPPLIATGVAGSLAALLGSAGGSPPSATARADIPETYLALYRDAAAVCPGLDWSVLAAIGKIESDHGRSHLPGVQSGHNSAGAEGPMQFLPATFARYDRPIPDGGADPPSPYDPTDAIYATARDLCASGARNGRDLYGALFAYNHADSYVRDVLAQAAEYSATTTSGTGGCRTLQAPNAAALAAITFACQQKGMPYVWGGNGAGDGGFDCSGLTHAAYAAAGIDIPRTADAQYRAEPPVPADQPLLPGDLVFFGTTAHVHHVGLFIGAGLMIDAPDYRQVVKAEPYKESDFLAAARPAASDSPHLP